MVLGCRFSTHRPREPLSVRETPPEILRPDITGGRGAVYKHPQARRTEMALKPTEIATAPAGTQDTRELMIGNHALVRIFCEAGVRVVTTYPGSPPPSLGRPPLLLGRQADLDLPFQLPQLPLRLNHGLRPRRSPDIHGDPRTNLGPPFANPAHRQLPPRRLPGPPRHQHRRRHQTVRDLALNVNARNASDGAKDPPLRGYAMHR